jgi:hypothetical protein
MKWNQFIGGIFIGLGFGLYLGGAIVDLTQRWNSTSSAGGCSMLVLLGAIALRKGLVPGWRQSPGPAPPTTSAKGKDFSGGNANQNSPL